jgi:hypothetical protein
MADKPRDVFFMTLSNALLIDMPSGPDYPDVLQTMEDIEVHVLERGSPLPGAGTPVYIEIFQSGDVDEDVQGPSSSSGAKIPDTATNNPFRTGPSGNIEFWAEGPREVDVFIRDGLFEPPANRVTERTFGWNATAVGPGSLPTSMLVKDGGITLASLADEVKRQMTQVGEVIDWWRPSVAVPIPLGFEICDGHEVVTHDFGTPGSINVPDLRNMFILGALPAIEDQGRANAPSVIAPFKPQSAGAGQGNTAAEAPGMSGTGGSNAARDLSHGHGVPGVSHVHYVRVPDHLHGSGFYTGNHAHSGWTGGDQQAPLGRATGSGTCSMPGHTHAVGTYEAGNIGVYGNTGGSDRGLAVNSDGPNVSLNTATNSTTWTSDPGNDMRPRFVGLLKLMKARRA